MKLFMTLFSVFIFLIYFLTSSFCFEKNNDIILIVSPDTVNLSKDTVYFTIKNNSQDTLILINEFYVEGILDSVIVFPLASNYSPNLLFLKRLDAPKMILDGIINITYYNFPEMVIIKPKSKLVVKVNISSALTFLDLWSWKTYGLIRLAKKNELDDIVYKKYSSRVDEYRKSILCSQSINSTAQLEFTNIGGKGDPLDSIQSAFHVIVSE